MGLYKHDKSSDKLMHAPIGVFDSGLGGLTLFKELKKIMPHENIIYLGDTARVPYGSKDKEQIKKYTLQDINFLDTFFPKIKIAACGTITSCLNEMYDDFSSPIGVINPTCLSAVSKTHNDKIGVMCTEATKKSKAYDTCLLKLNSNIKVFTQGCPKLVDIIESGKLLEKSQELLDAVKVYVGYLMDCNVDTIILGCTHYPIIKNIIEKVTLGKINLIDSGFETAKFVKERMVSLNLINNSITDGYSKFYVSGDVEVFSKIAKMFLGYDISHNIFKININDY